MVYLWTLTAKKAEQKQKMTLIATIRFSIFACSALLGGVLFFPSSAFASVIDHTSGRILLAVESHGEAWYVDPVAQERTYLGRPENAWRIMRDFGLGVTDADLAKIPSSESVAGDVIAARTDVALSDRLAGRILLRVEGRGEAWYVDPSDMKRYYLGRPEDAFSVMRRRALGILNNDLVRIPESGVSAHSVRFDVPFVAQAPNGNWSDARQADACEEASVMMAMAWVHGDSRIDTNVAEPEIHSISDFERAEWGYYEDTGIADTAERILEGWYKYENYEIKEDVGIDDVYRALAAGNVVIAPVDGSILAHPGFRRPYPIRHMVLVVGYDAEHGDFLVHEPGSSQGAYWRYPRQTFADALRDYPSGIHLPVTENKTAIIIVKK